MRKCLISLVTIILMVVSFCIPAAISSPGVWADEAFTPRTSVPLYSSEIGNKYYYNKDNIYIASNYGPNSVYIKSRGGYCVGNCTWWAYSRASEILGKKFDTRFCKNANQWLSINNKNNIYPSGKTPKVGAIRCSGNHVAIVEKIVDGKVYVSESGYKIRSYKPEPESNIYFHYGTPWNSSADGYIYILDGENDNSIASTYETTAVDYSVKISSKSLNMRTGPGTEYTSKGYITPGTYKVTKQSGNWAFVETGYWVSLDYCTKIANQTVTTTKATTATTKATTTKATTTKATTKATTASTYKVKVTAKDLNMRTGPGTSYSKKGYIKPGTHTIYKTSNGWGQLSNSYWIYLKYTTRVEETTAKTTATTTKSTTSATAGGKFNIKTTTSQVMRSGASSSSKNKGKVTKNKVYGIKAVKDGWGQLSSNGYWIKLQETTLDGSASFKITATKLNMRTGASTSYKSKGYVKKGTYTIKKFKNGWGQLKSNGYWVSLKYVKL